MNRKPAPACCSRRWHCPAFNLADAALTVRVAPFLPGDLRKKKA